ncbi:hypothetical protein CPB85DRAFT_1440950 [Mucidula mucida]|nr:hypothetical protein CPB85DRAFT_1440950 [Mucidula mucida]
MTYQDASHSPAASRSPQTIAQTLAVIGEQSLLDGQDGADNWSWDSFNTAMKKSETFTAPTADLEAMVHITYNESVHGKDGPMHNSYPGFEFGLNGNWTTSLNAISIESRTDSPDDTCNPDGPLRVSASFPPAFPAKMPRPPCPNASNGMRPPSKTC